MGLTSFLLSGPGTEEVFTDGCFGSSGKISSEEKRRRFCLPAAGIRRAAIRAVVVKVMMGLNSDGNRQSPCHTRSLYTEVIDISSWMLTQPKPAECHLLPSGVLASASRYNFSNTEEILVYPGRLSIVSSDHAYESSIAC